MRPIPKKYAGYIDPSLYVCTGTDETISPIQYVAYMADAVGNALQTQVLGPSLPNPKDIPGRRIFGRKKMLLATAEASVNKLVEMASKRLHAPASTARNTSIQHTTSLDRLVVTRSLSSLLQGFSTKYIRWEKGENPHTPRILHRQVVASMIGLSYALQKAQTAYPLVDLKTFASECVKKAYFTNPLTDLHMDQYFKKQSMGRAALQIARNKCKRNGSRKTMG